MCAARYVTFFFLLFWLFSQGVGAGWRQSTSILRVPTCSLPSMATFVTSGKPNFRVTSMRDPDPLISYHTDDWPPAYDQNSVVSAAASHSHEMRASVIMKTSDVTSSWPLTPDEGVSPLLPGNRNDIDCLFPPSGLCGAWRGRAFENFFFFFAMNSLTLPFNWISHCLAF